MKNKYFIIPLLLLTITGCGKKELVCLNGYTLNEKDETCERTVEKDAKSVYHCEGSNETLDGNQCRKVEMTEATASLKCRDGYEFFDGMCIREGTVNDFKKCNSDSTYSSQLDECFSKIEPITTYSCEVGQLEGSTCASITYQKADIEYVCEEANYKLQGNKCYYTMVTKAKDSKADY